MASTPTSSYTQRPSLLAVVHDLLAAPTRIPDERRTPHPFSTSYSSALTRLNTTLDTTAQLSHALSQLSAVPSSDQTSKLVSLMKQHTAISTSISLSRVTAALLSATRRPVIFPSTAPPSPSRLEEWARAVGMETFIDSSGASSSTTIMMAGKVLVLDIDIDGGAVVKTSFAVSNNNASGPPAAPDLDTFLARDIARWVDAANRASLAAAHHTQVEDPAVEAAYLGLVLQDHLRSLMMLDSLAVAEGERGIRWFMEPVSAAQYFLDVQKPPGIKHQPLDKMLARSSLPLLYLDAPFLSFLVWLSPLAYLRLLRSSPTTLPKTSSPSSIDIPIAHLTTTLLGKYDGATVARLKLVPSSEGVGSSPQPSFPNDHTFPQAPSHSWVLEFNYPSSLRHQSTDCGVIVSQSRLRAIQVVLAANMSTDVLMNVGVPASSTTGASLGNLGPFGSIGPVTGMGMGSLAFNGFMASPSHAQSIDSGSWVDLLLNNGVPAEYYKAIYNSPNETHPPLNLRLAAPQEPGFLLQEVPVKTASQVSRILDIVKEQCWLNGLLDMLQWQPDSATVAQKDPTSVPPASDPEVEESVSLELLASVLAGTVTPRSIPVSVYLPSAMPPPLMGSNASHFGLEGLGVGPPPITGGSSSGSLFGSTDLEMEMEIPGLSMSMNSGMDISMAEMGMELSASPVPSRPPPMIVLSSPARAPAVGMVELRASFGESSNKAGSVGSDCNVKVEASAGVDTRGMDEVVRRGGIWGLPGKVWVNTGPK